MRKAALFMFVVAFIPQAAVAKGGVKVLNSIPEPYWGTWAPVTGACTDGDKAAIVLSATAYTGPLGKCDVASVSEIPSPKGPTYSARLQCADPAQVQKKKPANVIIRPDDANQISAGPGFDSLRIYQRCRESAPAAKQ